MVGNASLCRTIDVSWKRVSRGSARQPTCCSSDPGVSTYLSLTRRNAPLTAPPECGAPVRTYIPELLDDVLEGRIEPGQVSTSRPTSTGSERLTRPWTSAARSSRSCGEGASELRQ